jgi:nucleotide-binding universal stress UspA family protein
MSIAHENTEEQNPKRFQLLLCIDGSEESKRGLQYAVKLGQGNDADITLLYVRLMDKGMQHSMKLARQNMLDWGFELPGLKALKDARDQLVEMGFLGQEWSEETIRKRVYGDPVGDSMKMYTSDSGKTITIKTIVAPSTASGILDECELNDYDLTILAMTGSGASNVRGQIKWATTRAVATEHYGTVLLARDIKENHGHLICVNDEKSITAAKQNAILASRCECPVYLFSVAENEEELAEAKLAIEKARASIESVGVEVVDSWATIGQPCEEIIEKGKDFSVIVMADSSVKGFRRFFQTSVAYHVLQHAYNSVMIIR